MNAFCDLCAITQNGLTHKHTHTHTCNLHASSPPFVCALASLMVLAKLIPPSSVNTEPLGAIGCCFETSHPGLEARGWSWSGAGGSRHSEAGTRSLSSLLLWVLRTWCCWHRMTDVKMCSCTTLFMMDVSRPWGHSILCHSGGPGGDVPHRPVGPPCCGVRAQ